MSDTPRAYKRSSLGCDIVVKLAPTAIHNSSSNQFLRYQSGTLGSSTYGRKFLDGWNLSRVQKDERSCAFKARSLNALCPQKRRRYVANLGQFLSGRRQEPIHRITRCHNHRFRINPTSDKSFRPHLIGRACEKPGMICFNALSKYLAAKARLHINECEWCNRVKL